MLGTVQNYWASFKNFGPYQKTLLYPIPSVFLGGGKVVPVFEITYLLLDLQVIFYDQIISIINSILF